jgi:hypothetical protein
LKVYLFSDGLKLTNAVFGRGSKADHISTKQNVFDNSLLSGNSKMSLLQLFIPKYKPLERKLRF